MMGGNDIDENAPMTGDDTDTDTTNTFTDIQVPILRANNRVGLDSLAEESQSSEQFSEEETSSIAGYYLAKVYIEHEKCLPLDEEEKAKNYKSKMKQNTNVAAFEGKRKNREKENMSSIRERERRNRQAVIAAKKNREVMTHYLKESMSRVRERDNAEEERCRKHLHKRMNALLTLKRNIDTSKENLSAMQAKQAHMRRKEVHVETVERCQIEKRGENADEIIMKKNRIRQFERDKEVFGRKQREREIEIVNKIISEEKQMSRRQVQQQTRRSKPLCAPSSGSESIEYGADVEEMAGRKSHLKVSTTDEEAEFSPYGISGRDDLKVKDRVELLKNEDENGTLAEPQFTSLWNLQTIFGKVEKSSAECTKYERGMLQKAIEKQKSNIVRKQVAAGREFVGSAFCSKPEVVLFKDFEVGKTYKRKVLLTNVSYSQNTCGLLGLTDSVKHFVDVSFTSPGSMSAGLTCDMLVTFKPMINENLEGFVQMRAGTGDFNVPIKCLIKCCNASVSKDEVDFKSQVVGEVCRKIITLNNEGALPTQYTLTKRQQDPENEMECLKCGKGSSGVLNDFSCVQLEVVFSPTVPGDVRGLFRIAFTDNIPHIDIHVKAVAVDLPVWLEREIINLKICMFDRLYQDAVLINNRATSALRLRLEMPKELREHMDLLPKTCFVQAKSQFSVQLKFLPRKSIYNDAARFFNGDHLQVPITIRVTDQSEPVSFKVQAVVTSSDFQFNVQQVDFGYCSIYESVNFAVKLVNKSILPQQYGFLTTPETVSVQPNDGFGTIFPSEELDIQLTFSPSKAQRYEFDLTCKSHIGREFILHCTGVGVFPPLTLSQHCIEFRPTAVNHTSSTTVCLSNHHCDSNQFTHSVPRIPGNGDVVPVGPIAFEFAMPPGAPVTISPSTGCVNPGEKCMIAMDFSPQLDSAFVEGRVRSLKTDYERSFKAAHRERSPDIQPADVRSKSKALKRSPPTITAPSTPQPPPLSQSSLLDKARLQLLQEYENSVNIFKLPCFVNPLNISQDQQQQYNQHYTLYVKLVCPSIRPSIILVTRDGDTQVNFGKVPIGERHLEEIALKNISNKKTVLGCSVLDPLGPFECVNVLREIAPQHVFTLKMAFTPNSPGPFYDTLNIFCEENSTGQVTLKGEGVVSALKLTPAGPDVDLGNVLIHDTATLPLKVKNTSELPATFKISLTSQSLIDEISTGDHFVGPSNYSGKCVFGCSPVCGKLKPGEVQELTVTFSPDHASLNFRDKLSISLNAIDEFCSVRLLGRGWKNTSYCLGWDHQQDEFIDLHSLPQQVSSCWKSVVLMFACTKDVICEKVLTLGCIKTFNLQSSKKNCEYVLDELKDCMDKGFTIVDPIKGVIDCGSKKKICIQWLPPDGFNEKSTMESSFQVTIKGENVTTYKVFMHASVNKG